MGWDVSILWENLKRGKSLGHGVKGKSAAEKEDKDKASRIHELKNLFISFPNLLYLIIVSRMRKT